jgi:zinc and cadmium transporter
MATVWLYSILSVLAVSLISFIGLLGITLSTKTLSKIVLYLVSFSAGALLGDALIHLLPETVGEAGGFTTQISIYVLLGFFSLFVIEKLICWRHCHADITQDEIDHEHHVGHKKHVHAFVWMNLIGDSVHNFIDGLIIAASYIVSVPVGIATTSAVILHEIPQEIGDFGVMIHGGFSKIKALSFNFITALTAVLGVIVVFILDARIEHLNTFLIPFAAGHFIYIAASDLVPEIHKELDIKKSIIQMVFFLLGIVVMFSLILLE